VGKHPTDAKDSEAEAIDSVYANRIFGIGVFVLKIFII